MIEAVQQRNRKVVDHETLHKIRELAKQYEAIGDGNKKGLKKERDEARSALIEEGVTILRLFDKRVSDLGEIAGYRSHSSVKVLLKNQTPRRLAKRAAEKGDETIGSKCEQGEGSRWEGSSGSELAVDCVNWW
jgi:hypothetical protein